MIVSAQEYIKFRNEQSRLFFDAMDGKTHYIRALHTIVLQEEANAAKAFIDAFNRGGAGEVALLKGELKEKLMAEKNQNVREIGKLILENAEAKMDHDIVENFLAPIRASRQIVHEVKERQARQTYRRRPEWFGDDLEKQAGL